MRKSAALRPGLSLFLATSVNISAWQAHSAKPPPSGTRSSTSVNSRPAAALYAESSGALKVDAAPYLVLHDRRRKKDLQLRVTYPESGGRYPVIVWSHGATGTKDNYQPLVRHWVSHGYVVFQANHSDSWALGGKLDSNTFSDWENRPKDVSFILDSLDEIERRVPGLRGRINPSVIGVGGHSFGAHTAQLIGGVATKTFLGGHKSHADKRPQAFLLISPQGLGPQLDEKSWKDFGRPCLTITGTNDLGRQGQDYTWRLDPFKYSPPGAKYLVLIEGAHHGFGGIAGPIRYRNAGPDDLEQVKWVQSVSTAFWDAYLKQSRTARAFLNSSALENASGGRVRIVVKRKKSETPALESGAAVPVQSQFSRKNATRKTGPFSAAADREDRPAPDTEAGLMAALERVFPFLDRNGDGALSYVEIPERMRLLRRAFDRFDRDHDGALSRVELNAGFRRAQQALP